MLLLRNGIPPYIYIFFLTTAHHTAQHTLFCIRYLTDGHDWSGVTLTNRDYGQFSPLSVPATDGCGIAGIQIHKLRTIGFSVALLRSPIVNQSANKNCNNTLLSTQVIRVIASSPDPTGIAEWSTIFRISP